MNNEINTVDSPNESEHFTSEISILDIVVLMLRNWWVIVLTGMILAVVCYAYSKSVSVPSYVSTGSLYIDTQREQITDDVNASALMQAASLMPTYIEIIKSHTFNQIVSLAMNERYSPDEIKSMVSLTQIEETNIMQISVSCIDKDDSLLICNQIMNLADDEILRVFEGGSVKPIDMPKEEPTIVVVNLFRRGIIGFMVGAVLATIVLVLFDMFDTRITSGEELTSKYKLPILGEIPNLSEVS